MPLGEVARDLPADEPLTDIFDADEDTNGAPIHGKILDSFQVISGECLVCGVGREEKREPGARGEGVNKRESDGRMCAYLTRWKIREVNMILSLFLLDWISV